MLLKDHLLRSPDRHLLPNAPYGSLIHLPDMPGNGRNLRTGFPEIEGRVDYVGCATGVEVRKAHGMDLECFPAIHPKLTISW